MLRFSIVLLLAVSQIYSGQAKLQCKGLGQYCTAHSQCCSSRCFAYLYKCVEPLNRPIVGSTTFNSVDELVDRFGGNNDATTANTYPAHPNTMPSTSFPVETNQLAMSTVAADRNESQCRTNGFSCSHSAQCCSSFCSKITNMCIHPTPNSLSTEQMPFAKPTTSAAPCYPVGHKCYSNIECCPPYRCHGYLHQCVT